MTINLRAKKVAGPDGLIPEEFKYSCEAITPFLVNLFNGICTSGQYPVAWTEAIIHPLHKKGDRNNPDNCKRLSKWVEEKDILGEIQAGFRKYHSTVDHIFTLFSMTERYLLKENKLHVAFIDFRKAFDLISYCKLWPILCKRGLKGQMLQTIQSMYKIVKARVRNGQTVTDAFPCQKGLKQGEVTSPLLFSLFIDELAQDIELRNGKHGLQLFRT